MDLDLYLLWFLCYFADSVNEGPAQDSQSKLKRARLADDLNEKIALRPGPLELVEKNIIPVDSTVKEAALKGTKKCLVEVLISNQKETWRRYG